ncbi:MAG: hypothetical protein N2316_02685 [Spirochaetes bacterium]|nr:hypothetical protein [Spirochaetota bacterium]
MIFSAYAKNFIRSDIIKKAFLLVLFFLIIGMVFFMGSLFLSSYIPQQNVFQPITQTVGLLILLSAILMAFASVYRISEEKFEKEPFREILKAVIKKVHYVLLIVFSLSAIAYLIVGIESAIMYISFIPYIGQLAVALLSGLWYWINVIMIFCCVIIIAITPLIALESHSVYDLLRKILYVFRRYWIRVSVYLFLSFSIFSIIATFFYYVARLAMGITTPIQWKVNVAFPPMLHNAVLNTFITDIIRRITPSPDPIGAFAEYGIKIFDYIDMIKITVTVSYAFIACIIISFLFSFYFRISSVYYKKMTDTTK